VLLGYWLEGRLLDFHVRTHWSRRLLAALIGALAFIALQSALKWLGTQLAWPNLLWQSVRGLLLGSFVAALMPWLLVRLRLLPARLG
ncbi:MAG: hypothetical protein IV111_17805, partial [Pseudomonas sp.]|nr:hypothetical protein [Pseudomonas sp.]